MKKLIFMMVLSLTQFAHAGTVYRDRFIPGAVCMVDLNGRAINAALILEVYAGTLQKSEYIGIKWDSRDSWKITEYPGWKVSMVNKEAYSYKEETQEIANAKKEAFLKQINEKCNR